MRTNTAAGTGRRSTEPAVCALRHLHLQTPRVRGVAERCEVAGRPPHSEADAPLADGPVKAALASSGTLPCVLLTTPHSGRTDPSQASLLHQGLRTPRVLALTRGSRASNSQAADLMLTVYRMEEIVGGTVGALHILARREGHNRAIIRGCPSSHLPATLQRDRETSRGFAAGHLVSLLLTRKRAAMIAGGATLLFSELCTAGMRVLLTTPLLFCSGCRRTRAKQYQEAEPGAQELPIPEGQENLWGNDHMAPRSPGGARPGRLSVRPGSPSVASGPRTYPPRI